jgi:peptide/nickel transport system substrate-binding protein
MPSFNRRVVLAGAVSLIALSLGALPVSAQQARAGGTLRISSDQADNVIHPLLTRVNVEYLSTELLYNNLTRLTADMGIEPDLAESWKPSDDLTEWVFTLRPGVKFHDGSVLTAKDVEATFKAILNPDTASPGRNNVGPIAEVKALDDLSVSFKLKVPSADFATALAYPTARIIPAKYAEGDLKALSTAAVGTGPFKLVSFQPDRLVVFEKNPDYWEKGLPYLDKVEIVIFPDITAEGSALIAGETDMMFSVSPAEFPRIEAAAGVDALRVPSGQFLNINFGCGTKPFDDVRVRQAIALTVDRQAMVDFVAEGYGTMGEDSPLNSSYYYYKDTGHKAQDIAKAKALLAEAGYPNGLDITLVASDRPTTRTQLGIAIREMAKPAGINIEVQTMPHATYLDQVWTKGSFYVGFYNMQPTADNIFSLLYTSDAAWNETHWNNKAFDELVYKARGVIDEKERREIYGKAQDLIAAEVPSVIPVFFDMLAAKRDWVLNYTPHPRGSVFRLDKVSLTDKAPERK